MKQAVSPFFKLAALAHSSCVSMKRRHGDEHALTSHTPPVCYRFGRSVGVNRIRARTGEGRKRAIANGVKMGRKPKMTPHQIKEALRRRDTGEPMREIARSYNVSHSTISRLSA